MNHPVFFRLVFGQPAYGVWPGWDEQQLFFSGPKIFAWSPLLLSWMLPLWSSPDLLLWQLAFWIDDWNAYEKTLL